MDRKKMKSPNLRMWAAIAVLKEIERRKNELLHRQIQKTGRDD